MKYTCLIVDDDTDLSAVTADCLEDAGLLVRTAASATEAMQKLDGVHLLLLVSHPVKICSITVLNFVSGHQRFVKPCAEKHRPGDSGGGIHTSFR